MHQVMMQSAFTASTQPSIVTPPRFSDWRLGGSVGAAQRSKR